jgi:heavy metal sensor kinase
MKGNPLRRISVRLTLWHSATFVVLIAGVGGLVYAQMDRSLRADLDQQLRETAQSTLALVELEHQTLVWEGTEPERITPDPLPGVEQRRDLIRLIDRRGKVVSAPPALARLPVSEATVEAACGGRDLMATDRIGRERVRVHTVPVVKNGRCLGALQVVTSLKPLERTLSHLARLTWFSALAATFLSLLLGQFLARRALNPVHAITGAARQISASRLSQRLRLPDTGDELSYLAASFDQMLDRIEAAYRRQREFAADASHELRTPLALIKGEASLSLRPRASSAEMRSALANIDAEADRLTRLVEGLLLLARLDRGEVLRSDAVGVDEVAHDVAARLAPLARERGVDLEVDAPDAAVVRGDETALARVVLNLVQNALEHTREGQIRVSVRASDRSATVEVSDSGCGIPAAHADRVFDRFYRVDASRSGGGAGLGLSLCRDVVEAHGGSIHLESQEGRGTVVTVTIPLMDAYQSLLA